MAKPKTGQVLFTAWCGLGLALFAAAALNGYSPFGDGRQEADAYSRGGGPTHK